MRTKLHRRLASSSIVEHLASVNDAFIVRCPTIGLGDMPRV